MADPFSRVRDWSARFISNELSARLGAGNSSNFHGPSEPYGKVSLIRLHNAGVLNSERLRQQAPKSHIVVESGAGCHTHVSQGLVI
jgi:hypothetical protein